MEIVFDEAALRERLSKMSPTYRVAFAACCAERLCPNYRKFASEVRDSTEDALEGFLSKIWAALLGTVEYELDLESMLERCLSLLPSEETQSLESAAYAEDAVAATGYVIRASMSEDPSESAWAARCAYETVDQYIIRERRRGGKEPFNEVEILSHPLCQKELRRQHRDLSDLEQQNQPQRPSQFFSSLRDRAKAESSSLFAP